MKVLSAVLILLLVFTGCFLRKTQSEKKNNKIKEDISLTIYKDQKVTDFFKRTKGAIAMDGGYSIPLSDNRVLWVFGDSYIDHYDSVTGTVPCLFQVRNSALLQPLDNWQWQQTTTLLSSGPGIKNYLKDTTEPNHFIWPSSGIQIADTVYVFCNILKSTKKGLGFETASQPKWGKIKVPEMKVVGFSSLQDFGDVGFGQGFIKDKTEKYVYVYGSNTPQGSMTSKIYLARFPVNNPNARWTFWNGSGWDTNEKNIAAIGDVPGFSWYICKINNKYLLLSAEFSLGCDQGKKIFAAVSDNPAGPFTDRKTIYTIDDTIQGHYPFFYGVMAHPEYINENNELLITYSINGYSPCIENCVDNRFNPDYYRLRAIRMPLELIDNELQNNR